jgi:hypothetical protein
MQGHGGARRAVDAREPRLLLQIVTVTEEVDIAVLAQHLRNRQKQLDGLPTFVWIGIRGPEVVEEIAERRWRQAQELPRVLVMSSL